MLGERLAELVLVIYEHGLWRQADLASNSGSSTWPWASYSSSLSPSFFICNCIGRNMGSVVLWVQWHVYIPSPRAELAAHTQWNGDGWWTGGWEAAELASSCVTPCTFWTEEPPLLFATGPYKSQSWSWGAANLGGQLLGSQESLPSRRVRRQTLAWPHICVLLVLWARTPHLEQSRRWEYFVLNLQHLIASSQGFV